MSFYITPREELRIMAAQLRATSEGRYGFELDDLRADAEWLEELAGRVGAADNRACRAQWRQRPQVAQTGLRSRRRRASP